MAALPITFAGESGQKYLFEIHDLDTEFIALPAVYVITRRYLSSPGKHKHQVIYVGQTEDLSERFDDHHKADCFTSASATSICITIQTDARVRLAIERDLCGKYPNAPCQG